MYKLKRILKNQNGNSFKRLDVDGLQSDPQWSNYQYKLYPKNLAVLQDSMQGRSMGFPQRVAILGQVISEKGGDTGPHGNDAFGLVGWRGERAEGLGKTIQEQAHKLMNEIYNDAEYREWTHGGKGTGVRTGKEMQQLFRNSPNTIQATNAFMKGYVRPPKESMQKRIELTNLIKRYMK